MQAFSALLLVALVASASAFMPVAMPTRVSTRVNAEMGKYDGTVVSWSPRRRRPLPPPDGRGVPSWTNRAVARGQIFFAPRRRPELLLTSS